MAKKNERRKVYIRNWRENLKAGDIVFVRIDFAGSYLATVTRVTAKQVFVYGDAYWKKNGENVGGRKWSSIQEATDREISEVKELAALLAKIGKNRKERKPARDSCR